MLKNRFDQETIVKCKIEGCLRPIALKKHGLCRGHYMRWYQGRPMEGPIQSRQPVEPYNPKKSKAK